MDKKELSPEEKMMVAIYGKPISEMTREEMEGFLKKYSKAVIKPISEAATDSIRNDFKEGSALVDAGYRVYFEKGANYVLDIMEQALTPQKCLTDNGIEVSDRALVKTALQIIADLRGDSDD